MLRTIHAILLLVVFVNGLENRTRSTKQRRIWHEDRWAHKRKFYCDSAYLKLDFVCDLDHQLSYTEAEILNRSLVKKFTHCFAQNLTDSSKYAMGILLTNQFVLDDVSRCNRSGSAIQKNLSLHSHTGGDMNKIAMDTLNRMANFLRQRWTHDKKSNCSTDILVLLVKEFILCYENELIIVEGTSLQPLTAVTFSQRLRAIISEQTALQVIKRHLNRQSTSNESYSTGMTVLLKVLQALLKQLNLNQPSKQQYLLGHWINSDGQPWCNLFQSHSSYRNVSLSAHAAGNQDWRAGFGGGLIHAGGNADRVSPFFMRRPASSTSMNHNTPTVQFSSKRCNRAQPANQHRLKKNLIGGLALSHTFVVAFGSRKKSILASALSFLIIICYLETIDADAILNTELSCSSLN
ncbi:UDP-3-O-acyl-N-acetylglucosamine deacetylase [Trichinella pseudospiralis]